MMTCFWVVRFDSVIYDRYRQSHFLLEPNPLHRNPDRGPVHDRAYAYTQKVVRDRWANVELSYLPAHCPQLYDRDHLGQLEQQFQEEFDKRVLMRFVHRGFGFADIVSRFLVV